VAHLIWMRRNSFIFEGDFLSPQQVASNARLMLDNFKWANNDQTEAERPGGEYRLGTNGRNRKGGR
jgi:hypothetical protein